MATEAAVEIPFATASPPEIREVLLPEELPQFEEQDRHALRVAAETFSLDKLCTGSSPIPMLRSR